MIQCFETTSLVSRTNASAEVLLAEVPNILKLINFDGQLGRDIFEALVRAISSIRDEHAKMLQNLYSTHKVYHRNCQVPNCTDATKTSMW
ncbi:MAG: hypothetical protein M1835_002019 [Candelina submexicana]|nr:MAG: hypothetical protein M1835_002019 [Candelina submexicana]